MPYLIVRILIIVTRQALLNIPALAPRSGAKGRMFKTPRRLVTRAPRRFAPLPTVYSVGAYFYCCRFVLSRLRARREKRLLYARDNPECWTLASVSFLLPPSLPEGKGSGGCVCDR